MHAPYALRSSLHSCSCCCCLGPGPVLRKQDCCMWRAATLLGSRAELDHFASRARACQLIGQVRHQHSPPIWYKTVEYRPGPSEGYEVVLSGKNLRTPGRNPLLLPTRALAAAVAAEWRYQDGPRVRPHTMPLMALASTAIDEPKIARAVMATLLDHLETDPVCCRHAAGPVADLQAEAYDPVLTWAQAAMQTTFTVSDSIFGTSQDEAAVQAVQAFLGGLDKWELAAVDSLGGACKSLLLASAVIKGPVGVTQALQAARLEENISVEEWGLVEGGHDLDELDICVRVAAPAMFARLAALNEF